ncbi:sporulation membrane protein YtaF [Xylanivirga thermophila]|uniref:sporulation membrane protein YtaF n=1 Tax=Xylanivirga thermophila TaxID=2496273 RepID=UPI00101CBEFE|nr:sporulation membrane protein YtaF [Xylanivirga thermophila]
MLETLLLVAVLSIDAFVASIAYGTSKIKVPIKSIVIINVVCSAFLGLSLFLGSVIKHFIPENITIIISFFILLFLGIYYLFESIVKSNLRKKSRPSKMVKFRVFDLQFIINIYVDETRADVDNSKYLSSKEAFYLAVALSLDSLAVGFGSSLVDINYIQILILSLVFGMIAVWSGLLLGRTFVEKSRIDLSWLSGVLLIILAILKLL